MGGLMDESLIGEFVAESREHLDEIEPDLLAMEEQGAQASQEIINRVFRAIHSIKGGAGFLAFESLKRLSHAMESVLMQVRDGERTINPDLMDVLLRGVDRLRVMVDDIQNCDDVPIAEEMEALEALLSGGAPPTSSGAPADSTAPDAASSSEDAGSRVDLLAQVAEETVVDALRRGRILYSVLVRLQEDLAAKGTTLSAFLDEAASMGDVLLTVPDAASVPAPEDLEADDLDIHLLYGTVLEADLVGTALSVPEDRVKPLDTKPFADKLTQAPVEAAPAAPTQAAPAAAEAEGKDKASPKAAAPAREAETLRVRVDLLTRLMNTAGELVLTRNQLLRAYESIQNEVPGMQAIMQNLDLVTSELQEGIMQTRMQPVGSVFGRYTRVVRDMARKLDKQLDLKIEGSELELDKSVIEMLADPLTHLVRNSCDHGVETPAEREAAGKGGTGQILLRAYHEGGQANICVMDDGRGLDSKKLLQKAMDKGVVTPQEAEKLSEREVLNLIFAPGFSTAEQVSDVSGRGVGMDVVRTNIEKMGGHIEIETALGQGTTVLLRLPLTLAIIPSLVVGTCGHRFAVPQVNLVELVWVRAADVQRRIEEVQGSAVLRLRGRLLPLVMLADVLDIDRSYVDPETGETHAERRRTITDRRSPSGNLADDGERRVEDRRKDWHSDYNILVLQVGPNQFGLIVDELFDSEEIVVKPLSGPIKKVAAFAGATILGDGRVTMILDVAGLSNLANLAFSDLQAEEKRRQEEEAARERAAAATRRSVIFFMGAQDEYFAVRQDSILRLERVDVGKIEYVGGREYVQYRGKGLPLMRLEHYLPVGAVPDQQELYLVIPKPSSGDGEAACGILVSEIVDAMDIEVSLEGGGDGTPGLEGSAVVENRLTLFVNPQELAAAAGFGSM